MQSLQQQASSRSGVKQEDAFAIDEVNMYERLGRDVFVQLSTEFYTRVYQDESDWFRSIFANSSKEDAIQNQYEFFIQRMGGPPLYSQRKGHPALIGRHAPYAVNEQAAERWLQHMKDSLDSVAIDADSKTRMWNFFRNHSLGIRVLARKGEREKLCMSFMCVKKHGPRKKTADVRNDVTSQTLFLQVCSRLERLLTIPIAFELTYLDRHTAYFLVAGKEMMTNQHHRQAPKQNSER